MMKKNYKEMTKLLLTEAELESRIPAKNARIGIKPNLVAPSEASWGATTRRSWPVSSNTFRREVLHSFLCWKAPGLGIKLRNLPKYVDIWTFAGNMEFLLWIHRRTLFMYATVKGWS